MKHNHHLTSNLKHKDFVFTLAKNESGTTYSDLTGRYPIIYNRVNQYIVKFYYCDSDSIQEIPTKTCNASEIRDANMSMLSKVTTCGNQKNLHKLYNEASSILKHVLLNNRFIYK